MHRIKLFNMIGHGVVMEGNRKMTGCLQNFGGHCINGIILRHEHLPKRSIWNFFVEKTRRLKGKI